jgi:hypothetical protein
MCMLMHVHSTCSTNGFEQVEKVLLEGHASAAAAVTAAVTVASSAASSAATSAAVAACQSAEVQKMAQLQAVLAAAHKYQVTPLAPAASASPPPITPPHTHTPHLPAPPHPAPPHSCPSAPGDAAAALERAAALQARRR